MIYNYSVTKSRMAESDSAVLSIISSFPMDFDRISTNY